jgi:hypothetical protein
MTDYVFRNGVSGMMRHATGGPNANYPWIGHPRERTTAFPRQPRFALGDAAWADDLATFQALVNANEFMKAIDFLRNSGFRIVTTDVPEAHRTAFIARTRMEIGAAHRGILAGDGWQ